MKIFKFLKLRKNRNDVITTIFFVVVDIFKLFIFCFNKITNEYIKKKFVIVKFIRLILNISNKI